MAGGENSSKQWQYYYPLQNDHLEFDGKSMFLMLVTGLVFLAFIILFVLYISCRYPRATATEEEDEADSIPVVFYRDLKKQASVVECCICLGIFEEQDKVKVLPPCGHCFHSHCVDKWLSTHSTCPLCRATLRVNSLV